MKFNLKERVKKLSEDMLDFIKKIKLAEINKSIIIKLTRNPKETKRD